MKTIKYNNKEYKLPFDVALPDDPTAEVEVKNRFSGQSTTMPMIASYTAAANSGIVVLCPLNLFSVSYTHLTLPTKRIV